jgi:UDP-N-acetylglucosamine--N-acetylmuramyl-(pentapeptide) pyrophosphoryl-undecaprenol N-acetylglucosamine transferase
MRIISGFSPDVVLGVGGYASYPTVLAAAIKGIPAAILEQNTVAGLANRILGLFADRIYAAFKTAEVFFKKSKVLVTGNPIRDEIIGCRDVPRSENGKFTVFVFGGSQGAMSVNSAFMDFVKMAEADGTDLRVFHQTGEKDFERVDAFYRGRNTDCTVFKFTDDMAG